MIYKPGIKGYFEFLRLSEIFHEMKTGYKPDRIAAIQALIKRGRISARLRQAESEREFYQRLYHA